MMGNSFATVHPELVREWSERNAPLTADQVTYGSNKIVWWKGVCGHEWQVSVKSRSSGEGCPICSGAQVIPGINDLASLEPELAAEWSERNGIKPTEVSAGSHKKVLWKGRCGHEWEAVVKNRVSGSGCPYCAHRKVLAGFNDLATMYPKVAAEWSERNAPLQPTMVTAFSNKKAWWKCENGHEWHALISTRSGGSQCPYCSGIQLLKGFNDLAATHPELAAEWSERNLPLTPDRINDKSRRNVWWRCGKCGYEWKSVVTSRVKGATCPVCADRYVLTGCNDLATTHKEFLEEWDFEKNVSICPEKVSAKSMKSVWWRCKCGHSWKGKIRKRIFEKKGCSICEREFQSIFPQLVVKYYANRYGLSTVFSSDETIGIPLDIYIPEEKLAITVHTESEKMKQVKEYLCWKRKIRYIQKPYTNRRLENDYVQDIIKIFQTIHIYFSTDIDNDVSFIRECFMEWRRGQETV
jgi:hypothetical protein